MFKFLSSIENLLSPTKKNVLSIENSNIQNEKINQIENNNVYSNNANNNNNNVEYSQTTIKYQQKLPQDHVIKILVLGGYSVGKSSILRRYLQECFTNQYIPTIGIDLSSMMIEQDKKSNHHHHYHHTTTKRYLINFLDVSFAEIKGKHISNILQDVSGIIMVFDSVNANSILSMDEWKLLISKHLPSQQQHQQQYQIPIALFANKCDIGDPIISASELDYYCKQCGYSLWRFTSSKKDISIRDGIDKLIDLALENKIKDIEQKKSEKVLLHTQKQQQQQQQRSQKKKERLISQSLPNTIYQPININNKKETLQQQQQQQQEIINNEKLQEIKKINEILESTNEEYNKIQKEIDELLSISNGSKRYNDLIKLERQRNNEYVNICNSLKKLIQPNFPHSRNSKVTKEVIYSTLEENIKKWNTLIQNLKLEQSMKLLNNSNNSLKTTITTTTITTTTTILDTSGLSPLSTLKSKHQQQQQQGGKRNNISINGEIPNKSKMGFGFKNNHAKMVSMATSLFNPSNTYNNIDTDNPTSSSSITTSSSTHTLSSSLNSNSSSSTTSTNNTANSSRNVSPSTSPISSLSSHHHHQHHTLLSTSPSLEILPSSYNLNTTILPIDTLVYTNNEFVN